MRYVCTESEGRLRCPTNPPTPVGPLKTQCETGQTTEINEEVAALQTLVHITTKVAKNSAHSKQKLHIEIAHASPISALAIVILAIHL